MTQVAVVRSGSRWLAACLVGIFAAAAQAGDAKVESFDWDIWARIATLEGGRVKPFETLAYEAVVQLTSSGKPTPGNPWSVAAADVLVLDLPSSADDAQNKTWRTLKSLLTKETVARIESAEKVRSAGGASDTRIRELRTRLKQFEGDYVANFGSQPNPAQLNEYLLSADYRSQKGDAGAKVVEQIRDTEAKLETVDVAMAALVREVNELLPTKAFFDALGDGQSTPPADALEVMRINRITLAKTMPTVFKPLEIANDKAAGFELRKFKPTELYVRLLMGWQGWDTVKSVEQLQSAGPNADDAYWGFHKPDLWDSSPLVNARFEAMGPKLKPESKTAVSVRGIAGNKEFRDWGLDLIDKSNAKEELTPVEEKAVAVLRDYQLYVGLRTGIHMICGPNQTAKSQDWAPLFAMLIVTPEQASNNGFASEDVADLKAGFFAARAGLLANNAAGFNDGSRRFAQALERMGKNSHLYPTPAEIARELHYNRAQPFIWTTVVASLASLLLLASMGTRGKALYGFGFAALLAALAIMIYGTGLRIAIAGRPPVTNMYETIMWSSFIAATLAVVFGVIYRKQRIIPLTAAVVLMLSTLLANFMPLDMGKSITPLQPVLRSNYWLIVHVMTIVGSYGAFMLAWGLGNVGLGYYLMGRGNSPSVKPLAQFCYRSIQVGVLMLAAGTILGGWWAAESWGRFWGWDPKEVWALIALIGYLIILHCRFVGWVRIFGTFAGSVLAFTLVVMAWYGVNFVLGAGLHAYAFGTGGLNYVIGAVVANLLYLLAASFAPQRKAHVAGGAIVEPGERQDSVAACGLAGKPEPAGFVLTK